MKMVMHITKHGLIYEKEEFYDQFLRKKIMRKSEKCYVGRERLRNQSRTLHWTCFILLLVTTLLFIQTVK